MTDKELLLTAIQTYLEKHGYKTKLLERTPLKKYPTYTVYRNPSLNIMITKHGRKYFGNISIRNNKITCVRIVPGGEQEDDRIHKQFEYANPTFKIGKIKQFFDRPIKPHESSNDQPTTHP